VTVETALTNTLHMKTLINQRTVNAINSSHAHVEIDLRDGEDVPTLRDLKQRQVKQAEEDLMKAMNKLLAMYVSIQEQAVIAQPNTQLTRLMRSRGIKLENR